MSRPEELSSEESNTSSSDQAVNESVVMLSNYFDLRQKSGAPSNPRDDEPLPSMFREGQQGAYALPHGRRGSSKRKASSLLLIAASSALLLELGWIIHLTSDNEAVASATAPAYPQTVETETSFSSAAPGAAEAPEAEPAAPSQPVIAEGEAWSETLEAYKELLAQQNSSNASASRRKPDDLGQYEAWLRAKP